MKVKFEYGKTNIYPNPKRILVIKHRSFQIG